MNADHRHCCWIVAALSLQACFAQPPQPDADLTLRQRSASALPGWEQTVQLGIDDITGGGVLTWVDVQGQHIAGPQRLAAGQALPFTFDQHAYLVQLIRLDNALIGEDFAQFRVVVATDSGAAVTPVTQSATPDQQIEQLLRQLAQQSDASLIRNGSTYPVAKAIDHLRGKWKQQLDAVRSVDDFIRLCATRSEQSGQPYLIRWADGRELPLAQWLREQGGD